MSLTNNKVLMTMKDDDLTAEPDSPLPADSLLSLDTYLSMLRALGERPQFEIVTHLLTHEQQGPEALASSLSMDDEELESCLDRLVDATLIEKRARNEPTTDELEIYYRPSIFARTLFDEGIRELFDREEDMQDSYRGSR